MTVNITSQNSRLAITRVGLKCVPGAIHRLHHAALSQHVVQVHAPQHAQRDLLHGLREQIAERSERRPRRTAPGRSPRVGERLAWSRSAKVTESVWQRPSKSNDSGAHWRAPVSFSSRASRRTGRCDGISGRSAIPVSGHSRARNSLRRSRARSSTTLQRGHAGVSPRANASRMSCCSAASNCACSVTGSSARVFRTARLPPFARTRAGPRRAERPSRPAAFSRPAANSVTIGVELAHHFPWSSPSASTGSRTAFACRSRPSARSSRRTTPACRAFPKRRAMPPRSRRRRCRRRHPRRAFRCARGLLRDVDGAVVERFVGAERGGFREFLVAAGCDPYPRAAEFRDLQRGERHAAADALDEHLVRPRWSCARVTSIRHAVSVASVNAAALASEIPAESPRRSAPERRCTPRTFPAGVRPAARTSRRANARRLCSIRTHGRRCRG